MQIRWHKATPDDLELLTSTRVEVLRAANLLSPDADMAEIEAASRAYYQSALADGSHTAYLVFDGDLWVGAGGVSYYQIMPTYHNPTGWKAYLMNIYTRPDYRRRGLARRTLDLLIEDAYARGITAVSLDATAMGKPLYVSRGFISMPMEMELPCP